MNTASRNKIPQHVAIIMDGNGRWAKQRKLPRIEGHRRGAEAVRRTIEASGKLGIKYLTLYAFSTENWNRPKDEVDALMDMLHHFLDRETKTLHKNKIRLRTIGRIYELPEKTRARLEQTISETAAYTDNTLILALNYSSRVEIVDAINSCIQERIQNNKPPLSHYDELRPHLDTSGIPDPDLIIRTSGETRLSNYLLLQAAYAELIFLPTLWPDFDKNHLQAAIDEFSKRERRYGLTSEQLQ